LTLKTYVKPVAHGGRIAYVLACTYCFNAHLQGKPGLVRSPLIFNSNHFYDTHIYSLKTATEEIWVLKVDLIKKV